MLGIDFIGPGEGNTSETSLAELAAVPGLPAPYRKDNLLSKHLRNTVLFQAFEISGQHHINPVTGEEFRCVSYYSEDQKNTAVTSKEDFGYLAVMSMAFVRRLVKIVEKLRPALEQRPRADKSKEKKAEQKLEQDPELNRLLEGNLQVSEAEALDIVSRWPSPESQTQTALDSFTIFYDAIRLIWVHEWAHALTGHATLLQEELGLSRLYEFSTERAGDSLYEQFPRNEVFQALEVHADEFATRTCIRGILWYSDPVADIAGPFIDLMDRLLHFNVACCIFAIVWALQEKKYSPDDTFRPPLRPLTDEEEGPIFATTTSTHPPAALRYQNFRDFQREITADYRDAQGQTHLSATVDAYSFQFVLKLGELSPYFYALEVVTPMIGRTPTAKVLGAYADHLVEVSMAIAPKLEQRYYLPTVDPYADESA
jgi:hypothetical protein